MTRQVRTERSRSGKWFQCDGCPSLHGTIYVIGNGKRAQYCRDCVASLAFAAGIVEKAPE